MTAVLQWRAWWSWLLCCLIVLLWQSCVSGTSTLVIYAVYCIKKHMSTHNCVVIISHSTSLWVYCTLLCHKVYSQMLLRNCPWVDCILFLSSDATTTVVCFFLCFRLQTPVQVSMLFSEETQQPVNETSKTLWFVLHHYYDHIIITVTQFKNTLLQHDVGMRFFI